MFDITPIVRRPAGEPEAAGVLLRFLSEDRRDRGWSGYRMVSREGQGDWAGRHPLLLMVDPPGR